MNKTSIFLILLNVILLSILIGVVCSTNYFKNFSYSIPNLMNNIGIQKLTLPLPSSIQNKPDKYNPVIHTAPNQEQLLTNLYKSIENNMTLVKLNDDDDIVSETMYDNDEITELTD